MTRARWLVVVNLLMMVSLALLPSVVSAAAVIKRNAGQSSVPKAVSGQSATGKSGKVILARPCVGFPLRIKPAFAAAQQ